MTAPAPRRRPIPFLAVARPGAAAYTHFNERTRP
jgi:hypothetical protein